MGYAKQASITFIDVATLETALEKTKTLLIAHQQMLKDAAISSAAEEIKAEYAKEREKMEFVIDFVEGGLSILASVGDMVMNVVNSILPQKSTQAKEIVGAFGFGIAALKKALKYWEESVLCKINEKERIDLEKNANSWNHLVSK